MDGNLIFHAAAILVSAAVVCLFEGRRRSSHPHFCPLYTAMRVGLVMGALVCGMLSLALSDLTALEVFAAFAAFGKVVYVIWGDG